MKRLLTLLAAALTTGFAALAQPQGPPPGGFPGAPKELSCKEKKEIGKATTEKMKSYLKLNEKQFKKLGKINKRYADVVGEEKHEAPAEKPGKIGRPIYGDETGPNYDTPRHPHPKPNGSAAGGQGSSRPTPPPGFEPGNGFPGGPGFGPSEDDIQYLAKRRAKYVKKLGKVLSADQLSEWKSRQRPFPGVDD